MPTRREFGERKQRRVECRGYAFILLSPDAPALECWVRDVSRGGIALEVGDIQVPEIFAVSFTADGKVLRLCNLIWRCGAKIGARFITAEDVLARMTGSQSPERLH